jgi:hypothetical protein
MAEIELVIKIPEEVKVTVTRMGLLRIPDEMQKVIDRAIQHSTPLPKGHGRLIDADAITKDLNAFQNAFVVHTDGTYRMAISCKAPIVIEADKEESEEKT